MTDPNRFVVTEGATGAFVATDTFTSDGVTQHFQYVKLAWGPDDTVNLVDSATGKHIPVQLYAGGSAITTTGNALDVNIGSSDITLNTTLTNLGITSVFVEGTTYATVPVMISGTTAIGGAVGVTGDVAVTGSITTTPSSVFGVTVAGYTEATIPVLISGTTAIGGPVGVTGNVTVDGSVSLASVYGVTVAGYTEATVPVLISGTTAIGGPVGVTGEVTVTATDLDIRGLTFGVLGATANTVPATTDSVVVQGASGAFPVTTLLSGASAQGVASTAIGSSGDALKVAVVGAGINATVNVGSVIEVKSGDNTSYVQVSGSSAGDSNTHPIIVGGCADTSAIPVTLHGACGGATIDVSGSNVTVSSGAVTATVSATDLDIRGLSFGVAGHTAAAVANTDSVVIQGVSGMYPVHNVLHGFTSEEGNSVPLGLTFDGVTPILRTSLDPRFATNVNALQVQGRADGLTLNPITIIGLTGSAANPLIGVTFSSLATQPVVGGYSADTLKTFLHGLSSGTTVMPVGVSGDALKVYIEDINVSASISDTSISLSSIDAGANVAVKGAAAGTNGVFVTGTGGTVEQWPVMVSGYSPEGVSAADKIYPVGVTYEHFNQLEGLSGGITAIHNALLGVCAGIGGVTVGLFNEISKIHEQQSFTNIKTAVGVKDNSETDIVTALSELHGAYVTNDTTPIAATIPVSVAAPTTVFTAKKLAPIGAAEPITTTSNGLDSGVRVKLPSSTTEGGNVFVGGAANVNATNGYLLEPGDDVFIEVSNMNKVFVIAQTTPVDVYAIGS